MIEKKTKDSINFWSILYFGISLFLISYISYDEGYKRGASNGHFSGMLECEDYHRQSEIQWLITTNGSYSYGNCCYPKECEGLYNNTDCNDKCVYPVMCFKEGDVF